MLKSYNDYIEEIKRTEQHLKTLLRDYKKSVKEPRERIKQLKMDAKKFGVQNFSRKPLFYKGGNIRKINC